MSAKYLFYNIKIFFILKFFNIYVKKSYNYYSIISVFLLFYKYKKLSNKLKLSLKKKKKYLSDKYLRILTMIPTMIIHFCILSYKIKIVL